MSQKAQKNENKKSARDQFVLESARTKWSKMLGKPGAEMIISEGDPVLRATAKEVAPEKIGSPEIVQVILDMKKALASQSDGVGLAAPQIGIPLRIFIVSGKAIGDTTPDDLVFINPVITKFSKEKKWMEGEGCLSVRWVYGKVERSTKVTLRAYDEHGNLFERGASGLLAHIFQHEVDHLNGILFIDKAKDLEEANPEEIQKSAEKTKKKVKQNNT